MQEVLRAAVELIDLDLDEVAGGHEVNVGIGQFNFDSWVSNEFTANVGIGENNGWVSVEVNG